MEEQERDRSAHSVPDDLIQRLQRRIGNLQMLPAVAIQALEVSRDFECSLDHLAAIIERDLKLTTFVLRMANSVLYTTGQPVGSLHQAVIRLGLAHCRSFIITSSLQSLSKTLPAELRRTRETLTHHGFLTASFAVRIGQLLKMELHGEDFTAGLMHDVGRTLLAAAIPTQFKLIDALDFNEPDDLEDRERSRIGAAHTDLGAWFAALNELPESLVAAIQDHHVPERSGEHLQLVAVTTAADQLANHFQRPISTGPYDPATNTGIALLEQNVCPGATALFADNASRLLNECPTVATALMIE